MVAQWKRELSWFASGITVLVVLVAGISLMAMWHVIMKWRGRKRQRGALARRRRRPVGRARSGPACYRRPWPKKIPPRCASPPSHPSQRPPGWKMRSRRCGRHCPRARTFAEMSRLVDAVKAPRVQVITLSRKGNARRRPRCASPSSSR
jgi:hypothetical protein